MEAKRHTINSTEQVTCPKTDKREALRSGDKCGGCGTALTADNSDQYGVLVIATHLGDLLGR